MTIDTYRDLAHTNLFWAKVPAKVEATVAAAPLGASYVQSYLNIRYTVRTFKKWDSQNVKNSQSIRHDI